MRKHLVTWQKVKEIKSHKDYQSYTKGNKETVAANPDSLLESDSMYHDPAIEEVGESVRYLLAKAQKVLTPRQWEAVELLAGLNDEDPLTIREAAVRMNIHPSRVGQLWDKARNKMNQLYKESLQ